MALFEVESFLLLGHYQAAVNAASSLKLNDAQVKLQRDVLLYRAHIEQGDLLLTVEEIRDDAPAPLYVVKLLAQFLSTKNGEEAYAKGQALLAKAGSDALLQLVLGLLFFRLNKLDDAFKALANCPSLEAGALLVQMYLALNRVDVAAKELAKLKSKKDDAIPTLLASAWVNVALGKEKLKDAVETYQELMDKYGPSVSLLNGVAVAQMQAGAFDKAEKALKDALVIDSKSSVTNINLFVCYEQQGKAQEVLKKQLIVVKSIAPEHPWLIAVTRADEHFDATAQKFEQDIKAAS